MVAALARQRRSGVGGRNVDGGGPGGSSSSSSINIAPPDLRTFEALPAVPLSNSPTVCVFFLSFFLCVFFINESLD